MSPSVRAFVTGIGAVCGPARGVEALRRALRCPTRAFRAPTLFPTTPAAALPVAEVAIEAGADGLPRTHVLALEAAREALGRGPTPDAIVFGSTTGGIATTENALKRGERDPRVYRFHGLDTVAAHVARALNVTGPVITISTACSSSAVAIAIARELLLSGLAKRVLAGGADSLCRLTHHGFRELQLISANGTTPFDADRAGITLGEGAAFLALDSDPSGDSHWLGEVVGSGLTCDAYHPTKPHPEGLGALLAIRAALADAALAPDDIDYVNLHGTGTIDNDATEALAIRRVFGVRVPPVSSTKGLTGHLLGGAGALEAVVSLVALDEQFVPANAGFSKADPALGVQPVAVSAPHSVRAALSNSFGFGGNNTSLVFRRAESESGPTGVERAAAPARDRELRSPPFERSHAPCSLRVLGMSCLTGAGDLSASWAAFREGGSVRGLAPDATFGTDVPPALVRRLKRLPRMVLGLAIQAQKASAAPSVPEMIVVGTAWSSLADTHTYLRKLYETDEQFSSPIDFVGSVHNSPAAQIAQHFAARGPNLTCSSGERSFAHALLSASLLGRHGHRTALLVAAEAWHSDLCPLLEPYADRETPSDGGAAFAVALDAEDKVPDAQHDVLDARDGGHEAKEDGLRLRYLAEARGAGTDALDRVLNQLGGPAAVSDRYGAVLIGVPRGDADANAQLGLAETVLSSAVPLVPYRDAVGDHASAAATATALAIRMVESGCVPPTGGTKSIATRSESEPRALHRPRILLLSLGSAATAWEVARS